MLTSQVNCLEETGHHVEAHGTYVTVKGKIQSIFKVRLKRRRQCSSYAATFKKIIKHNHGKRLRSGQKRG